MRRNLVFLFMFALLLLPLAAPAAAQEKISQPGEYEGYSEPLYDEWVRISQYVTVRDGTKLAADIFRPSVDGVAVDEPLPVVWTHHRYHRADQDENSLFTILDRAPELRTLIKYGYIVAAVDVRGGGASFGTRSGEFTREEALDAYDVTEWFAAQPWSTGNIGMYGLSYLGITQYMAASTQPPHLKAIFPMMSMFDMYSFVYPGGIFREDFVRAWGAMTLFLDQIDEAAPVDEDTDGSMLAAAMEEHSGNANIFPMAQTHPYRDTLLDETGKPLHLEWSPSSYIDEINASGVAIYHLGGWFDMYPLDTLLWFKNLTVPQKAILLPWSHNGSEGFDLIAEHLRWFDYWLKGIDNGIMDEPPITYYVMGAPEDEAWRTTSEWPLPNQQLTPFYFLPGPSGSVDSVNDGLLWLEPPTDPDGKDEYTVDYTTTSGKPSRWTDGYGGGYGYSDMTSNDERGLTYTTASLEGDVEVTGHPVVHLWVTATTPDVDLFAYLEEIDEDGESHYLTEGVLRASHRAMGDAPFEYMGLPYHPSMEADVTPLPDGEPVELIFDMQPTSNIFDAGNRIRITITGSDYLNYEAKRHNPTPVISLYLSREYASHIVLPIIPAK